MNNLQNCWQVRKCPSLQREKCSAFYFQQNCWERETLPCCRRKNKDRCETCLMYQTSKEMGSKLLVGCKNFCDINIYQKCSAYIQHKNCWEVEEKVTCCNKDKHYCEKCMQYFKILIQIGK